MFGRLITFRCKERDRTFLRGFSPVFSCCDPVFSVVEVRCVLKECHIILIWGGRVYIFIFFLFMDLVINKQFM